jgi:hypothetical protein
MAGKRREASPSLNRTRANRSLRVNFTRSTARSPVFKDGVKSTVHNLLEISTFHDYLRNR